MLESVDHHLRDTFGELKKKKKKNESFCGSRMTLMDTDTDIVYIYMQTCSEDGQVSKLCWAGSEMLELRPLQGDNVERLQYLCHWKSLGGGVHILEINPHWMSM